MVIVDEHKHIGGESEKPGGIPLGDTSGEGSAAEGVPIPEENGDQSAPIGKRTGEWPAISLSADLVTVNLNDVMKGRNPGGLIGFICDDKDFDGEIPDEEKSFFWKQMVTEGNDALFYSFYSFDTLVSQLGLRDSPLFQNEDVREDFRARLVGYTTFVEKQIVEAEYSMRGSEGCSNLSKSWKNHLRMAAYYIFIVHYGEKRKAEKWNGRPMDYAYHPTRAAFRNFIAKLRFFCEPSMVASLFHDVKENWHRGIIALLGSQKDGIDPKEFDDTPKWLKAARGETRGRHVDRFNQHFGAVCAYFDRVTGTEESVPAKKWTDMIGIAELVDILTKTSSSKTRMIVEMVCQICDYEGGDHKFSAARAFSEKIADRIDNVRSFLSLIRAAGRGDVGKVEKKVEGMTLETIYFYLALAQALGMWNAVDWLYDYIVFSNPKERARRAELRQNALATNQPEGPTLLDLHEKLRERFRDELQKEMNNSELEEGRDYIIEFRPIGFRYERERDVEDMIDRGSYAKGFQSFVIFRPVKKDTMMRDAAADVFKRIFPNDLKAVVANRPELDSLFGQQVQRNRLGTPVEQHSYSDEFGVGLWCVLESPAQLSASVLGYINHGYFYDTEGAETARCRVLTLLDQIEPWMRHLEDQYKILDYLRGFKSPANVQAEIRKNLGRADVLGTIVSLIPVAKRKKTFLSGGRLAAIEAVVDKLVMVSLMDRPERVKVVVKDHLHRRKEYAVVVNLPAGGGDKKWMPLVFAAPWVLGRRLENLKRIPSSTSGGVPEVHYEIGVGGRFNASIFRLQTRFLGSFLGDYQRLLRSDDNAARAVVAHPDPGAIAERRRGRDRRRRRGGRTIVPVAAK